MMNKVEEHPLPCASPSAVTFCSQIDENEFKSKSSWNPDWTIQREISITMDKSIIESTQIFPKNIQILSGILICIAFILSIVLPILISTTNPFWSPKESTELTTITTTHIESNLSTKNMEIYSCENLIYIENTNLIGSDLFSKSSMTWSSCCSWCLKVLSCRGFTYETISSTCYLKTMINSNEIFDEGYKSAKYP